MIIKVLIVRCSYCHAPLRDPHGINHMPRYFYNPNDIEAALLEQQWSIEKGLQICYSCVQKHSGYTVGGEQ